jgi:nucleoside-diphosphate-sugar epimerase
MAATLVALGSDDRAWGRAWHVPSALTVSQREALVRLAAMAGAPTPRISTYSPAVLRMLGLVSPLIRELPEVAYQMEHDFVLDSSAAQRELGLVPTPADDVLAAILVPYVTAARHAA